MLTENEITILITSIERYEEKIPHMYLGSFGFVTVGVGLLLSETEEVVKLTFQTSEG